MKMNICFLSAVFLCALCSEDTDIIKDEETMKPNIEIPDGGNNGTNKVPTDIRFTASSTVGEIISDPAFEDFGYLLFHIDRNVSQSMTLAEISSSNIYVWYTPYTY